MSEVSPRGTYVQVAEALRERIEADPAIVELPPVSELRAQFGGVSRTLINRALNKLKAEGVVTSSQGAGWRVVRAGDDARPLFERMLDIFAEREFTVGSPFLSEEELCQRFETSRTPVRAALAQLEGAGWLSRTPGKPRIVTALPALREEQQR